MRHNLFQTNGVRDRVASISLNPIQDHLSLLLRQKLVASWEVGDEKVCQDPQGNRQETLDKEDPLPAVKASAMRFEGVNELEAVRKDGAEPSQDDGREVEDGQTFLDFAAFVPGGDNES